MQHSSSISKSAMSISPKSALLSTGTNLVTTGSKLNTDGSAKGNPSPIGLGLNLRPFWEDHLCISRAPRTCSNVQAELKAIFRGLQNCKDNGLHKIWIEVDVLNVIKILENPYQGAWNLQHLLQKIRTLMRSLETKISYIYREGNQVAYFFANQACSAEALVKLSPKEIVEPSSALIDNPHIRRYSLQEQFFAAKTFDMPNCLYHLKRPIRLGKIGLALGKESLTQAQAHIRPILTISAKA
ncbi:hypothetical protein Sango_2708800 [Sesamum angolense]|uniref:RNase H type-1 domain-containing protein n=1 Tax=Sesamum angolense TaxID=2727404 RepID=A0AAE2BHR2_9LAMI|nr:hypothetical protein Sango_2708800 [Sesamum angolense]